MPLLEGPDTVMASIPSALRDITARTRVWLSRTSRSLLGAFVVLVSLALLVAHGIEAWKFKVDEVSLGLLAFASMPFLVKVLKSFKVGGVEGEIRDLPVEDQVMAFLEGISTKRQWTFFKPRGDEEHFGSAFAILSKSLVEEDRSALVAKLRLWLRSESVNQRWFAAEIAGYHQLIELKRALLKAPETDDVNEPWEPWELNCLWAASCFDDPPFQGLREFLGKTAEFRNQRWVLRAFDQMVEAGRGDREEYLPIVSDLVQRLRASGTPEHEISRLMKGLDHLNGEGASSSAGAAG